MNNEDIEKAAQAIRKVALDQWDEQGSRDRDLAFAKAALQSYEMTFETRFCFPIGLKKEVIKKCLTWDEPTCPTEMLHILCSELLEAGQEIARLREIIAENGPQRPH